MAITMDSYPRPLAWAYRTGPTGRKELGLGPEGAVLLNNLIGNVEFLRNCFVSFKLYDYLNCIVIVIIIFCISSLVRIKSLDKRFRS